MSEETIINDSGIVLGRTFHGSDIDDDIFKPSCSKPSQLLLVNDVASDPEVLQACQLFNIPISVVNNLEEQQSDDVLSVYVVNSFDGVKCNGPNFRVIGRVALLEIAQKWEESSGFPPFVDVSKPLYCHALSGQVICFTGFKNREELLSLKSLIQFMGGKVRKDTSSEVTHLVAKVCKGEKYSYAMLFSVPVVSETWIYDAWANRNTINFDATKDDFISRYKLKLFHACKICFLGYTEDEKIHMIEVLRENGGEPVDLTDESCTHVVTDTVIRSLPIISDVSSPCSDSVPPAILRENDSLPLSTTPSTACHTPDPDKENIRSSHEPRILARRRKSEKRKPLGGSILKELNSNFDNGAGSLNSIFGRKNNARSDLSYVESPRGRFTRISPSFPKITSSADSFKRMTPPSVDYELIQNRSVGHFNEEPTSLEMEECVRNAFLVSSMATCFESPIPDSHMPTYEEQSSPYLVVDNTKQNAIPAIRSNKTYVVKAEWFWLSIQYEYRKNESEFKLEDSGQLNNNLTPVSLGNSSLYISSSGRTRKRKRLRDKYLVTGESSPQSAQKRRSSVSDLTRLSEGSLLDYTAASTIIEDVDRSIADKLKTSKRYHKFMELWHTETNYVGILRTIMTLFKAELESMVDRKDQLLNATELKIIFGHLPPIYTTHCSMLEELNEMAANWSEDCSIGSLIQKYSDDLVKAYPPFINFFENTRDMLIKCDKTKPRFHAFLKLCQSKPECGRQSLQDLLIRPVQRLPSINLLLHDIQKNTPKESVDYGKLETAIEEIQKVMTYINEDKRRTEGQVVLFDIFNDIEKCPADLVSSHRCYINRCEVTELSDDLSGRGNPLVLFLFSDVIEVCKKRTKAFNKENSSTKHGNAKMYKHVELIPLNTILKVIDINETEECHNIFSLMVKGNQEVAESENKVHSFTVTDPSVEKPDYLRTLCNQIANVVCRTDPESYFLELEPQQLDIDSSDVTTGTLGKAFSKFASKTRKVGRALSFNKTPNKLKRAVSTMMSPFGNHNGLTPSSQLASLQLAALPPIPNYNDKESTADTPTSITTRKGKSSSFNMGSLRRL